MAGNNAVDLNDPATWPDDIDELTSLSDGLPDVDTVEASADDTGKTESDTEEKVSKEAVAEDAVDAEPETDETEEVKAEDEQGEEELPILARDGKNTLPFGVLAGEREKNARLNQRIAELEAQLERDKSAANAEAEAPKSVAPPVDDFVITESMQQKVDQLKEDWGEEIAETWLDSQRAKHESLQLKAKLDALEAKTARTEEVQRNSQEQQVQEAIDSSPDMALWQSQEDGSMYDRALAVHQTLMNTDTDYAAMNWYDRMQELPMRTRAMYGITEESPQDAPTSPAKTQKELAEEARAAASKARSKPPHSMSDLPKGDTPVEKSELDKLEGADGADIQQKLLELANNPEAYERYINSLM